MPDVHGACAWSWHLCDCWELGGGEGEVLTALVEEDIFAVFFLDVQSDRMNVYGTTKMWFRRR